MIRGGLEFASALKLEDLANSDGALALMGGSSILFGQMLVSHPVTYASRLAPTVAAYAFVLGLVLIVLALRFRRPSVA
jgi:uncharacterized membrane protein HdeD (DUF308 family)